MYLQILKLILWPRDDRPPRIVEFRPGAVNIISGASKTGKSAVIPIIDYCLGAEKCTIPVGVIRDHCAWFGVLIETAEGQKILARREPGDAKSTGDMFVLEGTALEIPPAIPEKNSSLDAVKATLDRLAGVTGMEMDPTADGGYRGSRPSFRDLMAFNFQPQHIVANPFVLFFKADTNEHREKLKAIFPYVLGAVTPDIMRVRWEIEHLQRLAKRKDADLRAMSGASSNWQAEAHTWIRQAIEYGLLPPDQLIPEEWSSIVDLLRRVSGANARTARPSIAAIDSTLARLGELRNLETIAVTKLTESRQRLAELRRLRESGVAFGGAIQMQRDRLALSSWLSTLPLTERGPLSKLTDADSRSLARLSSALEAIELQLRSHPSMTTTLEKEVLRQRELAERSLEEVNAVRTELLTLEARSSDAREALNRADNIDRFLGRLDQALTLYDRVDATAEIRQELDELRSQIANLQKTYSEWDVRRKIDNALNALQATASAIVPTLDAEWPDAPIRLVIEDLSLKVIRGARDDYLWEIGSGANWLAYHVAITVALQKFFLEMPHHPAPSLLVYDQPSQVYFPKNLPTSTDEDREVELRDEDVEAVRKIFAALSSAIEAAKSRLQVIVLDHADRGVWGGISHTHLVEEWRGGRKLVPTEWIGKSG